MYNIADDDSTSSFHEQQDPKLKQELINIFVKKYRNIYREVKEAIDVGNIKLAHRLVHTLKSSAGQLGKLKLQKTANDIEYKLKKGENLSSSGQIAILETELNEVLKELTPLVKETVRPVAKVLIDKAAALKLLLELEPLLKAGSINCLTFIEGLQLIPESEELIQHIEDYNFRKAMEMLVKLKDKL